MPDSTETTVYDCEQLTRINGTEATLCCAGCHRPIGGSVLTRVFNGIEVKVCCTYGDILPMVPKEIEGQSPDYPMPAATEVEHDDDCECLLCEEEDDEDGPY